MAIATVGTATIDDAGGADQTTYTATKPTGVVAGHLLIAMMTRNNVSVTSTDVPWIQFMETAATNIRTTWYYRIATASEGADYTWTMAGACPGVLSITAFSGVDLSQPICGMSWPSFTTAGASEAVTTPTTFNSANTGRVMYSRVATVTGGGSPAFTGGSLTEVLDHNIQTSGGNNRTHCLYMDTADFTGGGATKAGGAITYSGTETENITFTWVVKSADSNSNSSLRVF